MRDFELAMKAIGDPTRTRILKLLERGGLCVCQVQAVLGLAPSTVSKHLTVLEVAGLVEDRRDGKWIEYALIDEARNPHAKPVLDCCADARPRPGVLADRRRLREIQGDPVGRALRAARGEGVDAGAAGPPPPVAKGPRPCLRRDPHLLFVCIENSNRSQMAEGFARASGRAAWTAYSAGSRPSGQVNPRAIQFMKEKGIDLAAQLSKGLDELPQVNWDYIVTMGCGDACPSLPADHRVDWDLPDPKHLDDDGFRAVRDRIEALVRDLIAEATGADAREGTDDGAAAGQAAEPLRALSDALGGALHGGGRAARQAPAGLHGRAARPGVRPQQPDQPAHRGAHLADDLPDDAQDRLLEHPRRRASARAASWSRCS